MWRRWKLPFPNPESQLSCPWWLNPNSLTMEYLLVPSVDFKEQSQRFQMDDKHILSTTFFSLNVNPSKLFSPSALAKVRPHLWNVLSDRSHGRPHPLLWGQIKPLLHPAQNVYNCIQRMKTVVVSWTSFVTFHAFFPCLRGAAIRRLDNFSPNQS